MSAGAFVIAGLTLIVFALAVSWHHRTRTLRRLQQRRDRLRFGDDRRERK